MQNDEIPVSLTVRDLQGERARQLSVIDARRTELQDELDRLAASRDALIAGFDNLIVHLRDIAATKQAKRSDRETADVATALPKKKPQQLKINSQVANVLLAVCAAGASTRKELIATCASAYGYNKDSIVDNALMGLRSVELVVRTVKRKKPATYRATYTGKVEARRLTKLVAKVKREEAVADAE
jgi:hypothetical protein